MLFIMMDHLYLVVVSIIFLASERFAECENEIVKCQDTNSATYIVKQGDCLYKIAKAYQINWHRLHDVNPLVRDPEEILPGWVLCLPSEARLLAPPESCNTLSAVDEAQSLQESSKDEPRRQGSRRGRTKQETVTPSPAILHVADDRRKSPSNRSGDAVNDDIVQCQYMNTGSVLCYRKCTEAFYEFKVGQIEDDKRIMMRQCVLNTKPSVHNWANDDGVLLPSFQVQSKEGPELIIAACTFFRDRSFTCNAAYNCKQHAKGSCPKGATWSGRAVAGDPLKVGKPLKGVIRSNESGTI